MESERKFSITPFYYDPSYDSAAERTETAGRCAAEIITLSSQLNIISEQLTLAARRKDLDHAIDLCKFYYEDLLFRVYSLRERVWDVFAALVNVQRRNTGNENFRNTVLTKVQIDYPNLNHKFSVLDRLIQDDVSLRNVATHQTLLLLGLTTRSDVQDLYEIDEVLSVDPQSDEWQKRQVIIRDALRQFVLAMSRHAQEIRTVALDFAREYFGPSNMGLSSI